MSSSSLVSLSVLLVFAAACSTRATSDDARLGHTLVGPTATSTASVTAATTPVPSPAPAPTPSASSASSPRVAQGKKAALELVIADPSMPNEGIFGCVSKDVVIVLPLHPGSPDWKVSNASKGFGAPRTTLREGMLGPNTPGQEFRWSTEKMKGGSYAIDFASGAEKVSVSVVLACDD